MDYLFPKDPILPWSTLLSFTKQTILPSPIPTHPTSYWFLARNALYQGLKALRLQPGDEVLVPAYHCNTLVEPIIQFGLNVVFYNIHQDSHADFKHLKSQIHTKTKTIVMIHYFGFPQTVAPFANLTKHHGLYLIEDCAHVLVGESDGIPLGSTGDISIFSWRKFLPIKDSGLLVINNPNITAELLEENSNNLTQTKVAINLLEQLLADHVPSFRKLTVRVFNMLSSAYKAIIRLGGSSHQHLPASYDSPSFQIETVNQGMSKISTYLLKRINLTSIIEKRHFNTAYLLATINKGTLPGVIPFFKEFPPDMCPWVVPVLVPGRTNFHILLRSRGVPAFTWGGVIHPSLNLLNYPDGKFLYDNLILLPIHQSMNEKDMNDMITTMKDLL
jgi:perosamine synthetase